MSNIFFIKDGMPTINPDTLSSIKNASIIDVRTPEEYIGELGHIKNSNLITLGPDLDDFIKDNSNDKDKVFIFVCRSGMRSGKATLIAKAAGLNNAYNLEGGMLLWSELRMPVIVS